MKRRLVKSLCVTMALVLFGIVCAINAQMITAYLNYWYSNSNAIACWQTTPKVFSYNFSYNTGFFFDNAVNFAESQWTNAGLSIDTTASTNHDIYILGGSKTYLETTFGISLDDNIDGLTTYYIIPFCSIVYNGNMNKTGYYFDGLVTSYIIDNSSNSIMSRINTTAAHELGHAIGWLGHSTNPLDIMYIYGGSETNLTFRDKIHLTQFY